MLVVDMAFGQTAGDFVAASALEVEIWIKGIELLSPSNFVAQWAHL